MKISRVQQLGPLAKTKKQPCDADAIVMTVFSIVVINELAGWLVLGTVVSGQDPHEGS